MPASHTRRSATADAHARTGRRAGARRDAAKQNENPRLLREVLKDAGLSYRALAAATKNADPSGRGITNAYVSRLARGLERPTRETTELIAATLPDVEAQDIVEWWQSTVAAELDPRSGDPERARKNLVDLLGLFRARAAGSESELRRKLQKKRDAEVDNARSA